MTWLLVPVGLVIVACVVGLRLVLRPDCGRRGCPLRQNPYHSHASGE